MTIYGLKPAFQNMLRPACRLLARIGVTANQITVLAFSVSLTAGLLMWHFHAARWTLFLVPAVLFVRMGLNAVDGMLAREHNMKTPLGAMLNEVGDVASDTALYLPFAVIPEMSGALVVLTVFLAALTEMAGVVAVQIGSERRYDGPMGKSDRAFVFGLIALLLALKVPTGPWQTYVLWVMIALLIVTIINRTQKALKDIGQ